MNKPKLRNLLVQLKTLRIKILMRLLHLFFNSFTHKQEIISLIFPLYSVNEISLG